MPGWSAAEDEAAQLNTPFPAFLVWAQTDEGQWWLRRLRLKWQIQAAARGQEQADRDAAAVDARWQAQGWRGGRTAPAGRARGVSDAA